MGVNLVITEIILWVVVLLLTHLCEDNKIYRSITATLVMIIISVSVFLIAGVIDAIICCCETNHYSTWWSMNHESSFIASMLSSILIYIFLIIYNNNNNNHDTKRDSNGNCNSNSII